MPRYSLHHSLFRSRTDRKATECSTYSTSNTPLLESPRDMNTTKFPSLPTPPISPSPSAPSVVFPTKISPPPSPTPFKRRALTIPMGCRCSSHDGDEIPSEPKHPSRCLAVKVLRNMKQTRSHIPRPSSPDSGHPVSYRPAPSSRSSSRVQISRPPSNSEMERSAMSDPSPPVLTLPNDGVMDVGLGWADEFGIVIDTRIPPPRPWSTTFTHSSNQTTWSQPSRPPSSHSGRDYPMMPTGFFSSKGTASTMPSPMTVLNAAGSRQVSPAPLPSEDDDPFLFKDTLTVREDMPSVQFQEVHETASAAPRLGFQLRRSAEDWATAVLKAVGTSVDR